jgi:hypothetical protein
MEEKTSYQLSYIIHYETAKLYEKCVDSKKKTIKEYKILKLKWKLYRELFDVTDTFVLKDKGKVFCET